MNDPLAHTPNQCHRYKNYTAPPQWVSVSGKRYGIRDYRTKTLVWHNLTRNLVDLFLSDDRNKYGTEEDKKRLPQETRYNRSHTGRKRRKKSTSRVEDIDFTAL